MILDAGFLISVDRNDQAARTFLDAPAQASTKFHTTHPVLAQVWRNGSQQARLGVFLKFVTIHPLDDGRQVGHLLAQSRTSDVVDAHLVATAARIGHDIITGDPDDLKRLTDVLGPAAPTVHPWP